jgi:hypothetical protein
MQEAQRVEKNVTKESSSWFPREGENEVRQSKEGYDWLL